MHALIVFGDRNAGGGLRSEGLGGRFFYGRHPRESMVSYTFDSAVTPPMPDNNLAGLPETSVYPHYLFSGIRGNNTFVGWMSGEKDVGCSFLFPCSKGARMVSSLFIFIS